MTAKTKSIALGISALVLFAIFTPAAMAEYPEKTITMYCCFSPGGTVDTSIRALVAGMEQILGQRIVIVTKDGGSGTVGLAVLAGEKPDGYTMAAGTSTGLMSIPLTRKMTYKPRARFTNIL